MSPTHYLSAILVLAKVRIKRFFRDRVALFFTFLFPVMFLMVFGGIFGRTDHVNFRVALVNDSDTEFAAEFARQLDDNEIFLITAVDDVATAEDQLGRGEYGVILRLPADFGVIGPDGIPTGQVITYHDVGDQQQAQTFNSVMGAVLDEINQQFVPVEQPFSLETRTVQTANLTQFDYVFSGLLGFTILTLGFFGLANGMPADKKAGILRRLRSTPLKPSQLIFATMLEYMLAGLLAIALMFVIGVVAFDFNMRGDFLNFFGIVAISIVSMFGFGLAIAGWAKNENQAAPLSNVLAFPMMFLSGVFFPRFLMPGWLEAIAQYIPLSPIIDGIRLIITEGKTLLDIGPELAIIGGWTVFIYLVAAKTFRWE